MPNFVWTAKDKFGKSAIREITADTAEQAKAQLLGEGCTELELKENEIFEAAVAGFTDKTVVLGEEVKVTAEQRFKHRGKPSLATRQFVTDFHFRPVVAAFGRKPHLSFFSKKCGGLPTAATTVSGTLIISEGRVPHLFLRPPSPVSSPQGEDIPE